MRWLFVAVLAVGVVLWLTLAWQYRPSATGGGAVSRQMMVAALVVAGEGIAFVAVFSGLRLTPWLFLAVFAASDAVAVGWLILLRRYRRTETSDSPTRLRR